MEGLETLCASGVQVGFGTDLIGDLHGRQATELSLRSRVLSPPEVLRQATSVNAAILRLADLGRIAPGYLADLILVDGDPLSDLGVFDCRGTRVSVVIKEGQPLKGADAVTRQ